MNDELEQCPSCGSAAELVMNTVGQFCARCTHYKCGAVIITEVYSDAVNAWNRRVDENHADN